MNVYHLAATPMGMTVTFTAEVIGVEGRRVNFKVEAWDEKEKCGEGTHERAIVNIAGSRPRCRENGRAGLPACPAARKCIDGQAGRPVLRGGNQGRNNFVGHGRAEARHEVIARSRRYIARRSFHCVPLTISWKSAAIGI